MSDEEKANELIAGDESINISTVRLLIKNKTLQMAKLKEQQMIGRALKHLQDVYTQFDITDTNGYRIDFEFFKYEFEKAMKGE